MLSNNQAEVQTKVITSSKEIPIFYRVILKEATWKVYDVVVENVSLVQKLSQPVQLHPGEKYTRPVAGDLAEKGEGAIGTQESKGTGLVWICQGPCPSWHKR